MVRFFSEKQRVGVWRGPRFCLPTARARHYGRGILSETVLVVFEVSAGDTTSSGGLPGTLTLVDATLISAMPRIMTASVMKQSGGSGLVPMSFPTKWCCSAHPAKRPIAPTIPCDWSSSRFGRTSREGNTREDHRVSIAMASCELRQTCSTFPPRSSRSCTLTVEQLKSSSGSSSICWAAVTC